MCLPYPHGFQEEAACLWARPVFLQHCRKWPRFHPPTEISSVWPAIGTGVDCFRGFNFWGSTALENKKFVPDGNALWNDWKHFETLSWCTIYILYRYTLLWIFMNIPGTQSSRYHMQYINIGKYAFFTVNTMKQGDKKVDLGGGNLTICIHMYIVWLWIHPSHHVIDKRPTQVATCWEELFASSEMRYTVTMPLNDKWIQVRSTNLKGKKRRFITFSLVFWKTWKKRGRKEMANFKGNTRNILENTKMGLV